MPIVDGVTLEAVSGLIRDDAFDFVRTKMGTDAVETLQEIRHAFVHRYDPKQLKDETGVIVGEEVSSADSASLLQMIAACLRLIRPMRQMAVMMSGSVREDGTFEVDSFDHPLDLLEVPQNQKLFHLRDRDVADLRRFAPEFLRVMKGEFWKFRMAVQFHELGHFQDHDWKARYLLWASAIESIYTSHHRDHKGSLVAKERIKWFLGENTSIYPPGELSTLLADPNIAITAIVGALYEVRNFIAHGDRIPDHYFQDTLRDGFNGRVNVLSVLFEASSFVIRFSLLKILRDSLEAHFQDAAHAEAYFAAQNLTHTELVRRLRP